MDTMSQRPLMRDLLGTDYGWTPRQREVLDLIARGRSNQEVADELGISLDGAKWHMREILGKLGVDTREEAAEYWRRYNGWPSRFERLFRAVTGASTARWVAAALAGVAVVGATAIMVVIAVSGGDDAPNTGGTQPTSTPTTATPGPSPTAAPSSTAPAARVITLDTSPKAQPLESTRAAGPAPDSPFPDWDGTSTVIYDVDTGKAIDLGPGAQPAYFSPDETMAVFAAGPALGEGTEVILVELPSGKTQSLGPGRVAVFIDNQSVMAFLPDRSNERVRIDIATGARSPFTGDSNVLFSNPQPRTVPTGYAVEPSGPTSPEVRTYRVTTSSGALVATVDAVAMSAAGPDQVAVVSPAVDGRSNVYILNLMTGDTTYVASAMPGKNNFPFSANEDYVVWTDGYCGLEGGPVTLFDRSAARLIRVSGIDRWARLTSTDLVGAGSFGARALIKPDTLEYVTTIPAGGDVSWSANHRYASHGPTGGHGGLC